MCGLMSMPEHSGFAPIMQPLFLAIDNDFTRFEKAFQKSVIPYYVSMVFMLFTVFSMT